MSNFFAMAGRMRLINRWSLMQNASQENIAEHSHSVAVLAHALCVIGNKKFGKSYNAERCALLALYHDTTEVITGDMPTPVKYYNNDIKSAYKSIESAAGSRLLDMLPEELKDEYSPLFNKEPADEELWKIVKAADKIDALIKCINETRLGNKEFEKALEAQKQIISDIDMDEVRYFEKEFLPAYYLTLDEHTKR